MSAPVAPLSTVAPPAGAVPPVSLTLPKPVAPQRFRAPKKNIPQTPPERNALMLAVRAYVERERPVPPLPAAQLREHAEKLVARLGLDPVYTDYTGVLINNELWRESLAAVPYERRLLLIPKCLRVESKCPAPFDEFGLLCKQCGLCSIQDLQNEAERLGYAVLVAEGSAIVMSLIQTGKIEAIVGVSCLSVLERAFPYMEAAAIPGVAVPLLQDDCIDTTVDLDWVWDYIHLTSEDKTRRMDLGTLREEVDFWFTPLSLDAVLGPAQGETERIARQWLGRAGKRWRPFLTVAVHQALQSEPGTPVSESLKKVAVAVECFHKASLIHDDIEDGDSTRYGESTLHEEHGVPVALNVGDLLIGEGYRLIAESGYSADQCAHMLRIAAQGQRKLCVGQGAELLWARSPKPMASVEVLDVFEKKTAPAFAVALHLGALAAGSDAHAEVARVLEQYSRSLGIAYQIRDDLQDYTGEAGDAPDDITRGRMGVVLAAGWERAQGEAKAVLDAHWRRVEAVGAADARAVRDALQTSGALDRCRDLLERYKEESIRSLGDLENASLKGLLRRVVGKIFNDTEIKGWCKEFEPVQTAGPAQGAR
jgi:geranylgeranyl pyrophosphate synthase